MIVTYIFLSIGDRHEIGTEFTVAKSVRQNVIDFTQKIVLFENEEQYG